MNRIGLLAGLAALGLPSGAFALTFPCPVTTPISISGAETLSPADSCDIQAGGSLNVQAPGGSLLINEGALNIDAGGSLNNARVLNNGFNNPNPFFGDVSGGTITNAGNLTNSAGALLTNELGGQIVNTGTLINQGSLSNGGGFNDFVNDTGATLTNQAGAEFSNFGYIQNRGMMTNEAGASLITNGGSDVGLFAAIPRITNTGTFINSGSLSGGSFENEIGAMLANRSGATANNISVDNRGTLTNEEGATLLGGQVSNSGSLVNAGNLASTSISGNGGTMSNQSGALFSNKGFFINSGTLTNQAGATIDNQAGQQLNNSGAIANQGSLVNAGSFNNGSFGGNGVLNNTGSLVNQVGSTLTNASGSTLTNLGVLTNDAAIANAGTVTNTGTFAVTASGTVSGSGIVTQTDGALTVDGSLTQAAVNLNGGILNGTGTLNTTLNVDGGTVAPGHSPGTLTINGDFNFTGGILDIEIGGLLPGQYDLLEITGAAHFLGGTIRFDFINGFLPAASDFLAFLDAASIDGLSNMSFAYTGLAPGFQFSVDPNGGALRFTALNDGQAVEQSSVPEPATLALAGIGLGLVRWQRTRAGSGTVSPRRYRLGGGHARA